MNRTSAKPSVPSWDSEIFKINEFGQKLDKINFKIENFPQKILFLRVLTDYFKKIILDEKIE